jgi:hypothetical protein
MDRYYKPTGPCYYCGKATNPLACNPSEWPIHYCHREEPGVAKAHCTACVSERTHNYGTAMDVLKDMCDAEEEIRKMAAPLIGEWEAYGDSYGVPCIETVVEELVKRLEAQYE